MNRKIKTQQSKVQNKTVKKNLVMMSNRQKKES